MPPEVTHADLMTQTDREIDDAMRAQVAQLPEMAAARSTGAPAQLEREPQAVRGQPYHRLCERSPEYLGDYWGECRALYAGGARLLRDEKLLHRVFPKHANEADAVYKERCQRAFYIAYPGEIIDNLLAGFAQDPLRLSGEINEENGEEAQLPTWWSDFGKDVSPPGGMRQPVGSFAVDCLREMFVTQSAWVLVDLAPRDPNAPAAASKLEEEQAGLLDPYLCLMPSENVVDWQVDEDSGELEWVLCYWRTRRRDGLSGSRNVVSERWLFWDREGWQRFETRWEPSRPPEKDEIVPLTGEGVHTLGVVPFVRLQVPEGLYAMGKLESIAREHFNKRCAAAWAEYKSLFAVLYEFMAPEEGSAFAPKLPISMAQQDPGRASNQLRGQGYSQLRGHEDSAKYIGPEVAPFKESRESCAELMREMHRVMFSMALSANMDTAALQRSGESKAKDAAQIAAILGKVGELLREGFNVVFDLVARLRHEEKPPAHATGGEKFDAASIADSVKEATELTNGVPMKSPTFLKRYLMRLYKLALGPTATQQDLEAIKRELDDVITAESLILADAGAPGRFDDVPAVTDDAGDAGGDDRDDEKDEPAAPQPKPTAQPRSRRLYPAP